MYCRSMRLSLLISARVNKTMVGYRFGPKLSFVWKQHNKALRGEHGLPTLGSKHVLLHKNGTNDHEQPCSVPLVPMLFGGG